MNTIMYRLIAILMIMCGIYGEAAAAEITAVKTGNWNDKSVWSGGVLPTENDDVVIDGKKTITINDNDISVRIKSLIVRSGSTLSICVSNGSGNILEVLGDLTNDGNVKFPGSNLTMIVHGSIFNSNKIDLGAASRDNNIVYVQNDFVFTSVDAAFNYKGRNKSKLELGGDLVLKSSTNWSVKDAVLSFYIVGDGIQRINSADADLNLNFYDLVLDNSSLYTEEHLNDGVHSNVNIIVSNKLTLTNGILYLAEGKHIETSTAGSSSGQYLEASNVNSFVDGYFIRNVAGARTFLFAVGHNGRSGYAFVKSSGNNTRYGVRYFDSKPQMGKQPEINLEMSRNEMVAAMLYATLSEEYWMVSNESNSYKARLFQARVPEELKDTYNLQKDGGISKMYAYYNTEWNEFLDSEVNPNEGLYKGLGTELVVSTKPDNNTNVLGIGKESSGGEWYFTYGIHKEHIVNIVGQIKAGTQKFENPSSPYTWTGIEDENWNNAQNWFGKVVPAENSEVIVSNKFTYGKVTIPVKNFEFEVVSSVTRYPSVKPESGMCLAKTLDIKSEVAKVTLNPGSTLVVSESVTVDDAEKNNAGHVVINQRYDSPANFICASTNYNKFTINRTFKTNRLYYNGSATKEGTLMESLGSGDVLEYYNVDDESYTRMSDFTSGVQFSGHTIGLKKIDSETERTITQIGSIQTASKTFSLSTTDGYEDGWNLITNPFQASVDLNSSGAISFTGNVAPSVWFRVYDGSKYSFSSLNVANGVLVIPGTPWGSSSAESSTVVAPQQAFFVLAGDNSGSSVTLKRPAAGVSGGILKAAEVVTDVLRLTVNSGEAMSDEMAFVFREGGTMDAASVDTYKRFEKGSYNQIYSLKGENANAISWYPAVSEVDDEILPIAVRLSSLSKNGVITATNLDVFDESVDVTLVDDHEKIAVDLRKQNEYQFEASANGETLSDRFYIVLKSVEADVENEEGDRATAIEKIETKNQNGPAYNVIGQRVARNYRGIVVENGKKYIKW